MRSRAIVRPATGSAWHEFQSIGENMTTRKVAFVCLHGSAKSLIAAEYFNRLAQQKGLEISATTSGPEPDPEVPSNVIEGMRKRGFEVGRYRPTLISAKALAD